MGDELSGPHSAPQHAPEYILLYDGLCAFCNGTVQLIIHHDTKGTMRFAALQSPYGLALLERHPFLRTIDSLILIDTGAPSGETIHVRSDGALIVAGYLGRWWNLFRAARIIPRPLRDYLYDLFAKHRYRFFGRFDACLLPPPDVRSRFLE